MSVPIQILNATHDDTALIVGVWVVTSMYVVVFEWMEKCDDVESHFEESVTWNALYKYNIYNKLI